MAELGRLAGGLVHELKNPLGVILLNAELAQGQMAALGLEPTERERLEKRVRRIQDSARSLQSIVQSFLAFTRPTRPDPEAVDLNGLLEELLDEQDDLMVEDGVTVSFHPDPGLPAVAGDRGQLRSVFLNIMTNAREALRGRVGTEVPRKLAVLTRAAQGQARVMLINNGPPIPERVLARLFQPFVSSKEDGTGLGLAIVRRLVELHHGTITASSDPNQGVSFTIEFPTALGPAHARTELPMPEVEAVIRDDAVQVPVVTASDVRKKPRKNTRTTRT
jgi:signal transduction histidine kinase